MASAAHRWSGTIPSAFTPQGLYTHRSRSLQSSTWSASYLNVVFVRTVHVPQDKPVSTLTIRGHFQVNSPPGVTPTQRPMSGPAGAAPPTVVLGLGLDISGRWHQRAVEKSRALVQTYLLASSVHPPPSAGGGWGTRTPVRLPSLGAAAKGPRRRSGMARLSLSEPSLVAPNENILFDGLSSNRRPSVLQKRPPPPPFSKSSVLLPCKTCHPPGTSQHQNQQQVQSCSRPAYIHFSQAIQPGSKPRPVRRHSHNPAQSDLRPLATQSRHSSSQGEPLSVVGKPCLPSCSERPPALAAAAGPARTQLHVFLPTEAEGEEGDSESVDEGFMDELDSRLNYLKLQQGAPKTLTYH